MNYLNRFIVSALFFVCLGILLFVFLPSNLKLRKSIIVDGDKEQVEKNLAVFRYKNLAEYLVDKETWEVDRLEGKLKITSEILVDYGFSPIAKFYGFFNREQIELAMVVKLDSLKFKLEDLPKIHTVDVNEITMEKDLWFLSIRDTVNQQEVSNIHGKLYSEINRFMDSNKIISEEAPMVIYHFWSDTLMDLEAGIPVDSNSVGKGRIRINKIKKGKVVSATHYGSYERLPETYFGINEWIRKNKAIVVGVPWEVYITDPGSEVNPEKWETAIFIPVK